MSERDIVRHSERVPEKERRRERECSKVRERKEIIDKAFSNKKNSHKTTLLNKKKVHLEFLNALKNLF